jgi:uncharacterized protein YciI
MFFAIKTFDKPDHFALRQKLRAEHLDYLDAHKAILVAAGGILTDDGEAATGGLLIVDVADRAAAEAFIAGDPFTKGGLFREVTVERWRKAFFDHQRHV